MSVRPQWTVFCNGPDCLAWIGQEDTKAEARARARSVGWLPGNDRNRTADLCAAHKPAPELACTKDGARIKPVSDPTGQGQAVYECVYCGDFSCPDHKPQEG